MQADGNKRGFTIGRLNIILAFKRECSRCGAAIGAVSYAGKAYDARALSSNIEGLLRREECPYCTNKGKADFKIYPGSTETSRKLRAGDFSNNSIVHVIKCEKHGFLHVFIKAKKDVRFSEIKKALSGCELKDGVYAIPRQDIGCPVCGDTKKVQVHEVTAIANTPLPGAVKGFIDEASKYEPIRSPLLHLKDRSLKAIAERVFKDAEKRHGQDKAPVTTALLDWMNSNITEGISKGLSRGKLVRSDLDVLADGEASGIEYCLLFYSLARYLEIDCTFGVNEESADGLEDCLSSSTYLIIAEESGTALTIAPPSMYSGRIKAGAGISERIDVREFLRRISLLSEISIVHLLSSTPFLYYFGKNAAWLYRPQPAVLSLLVTKGAERILEFRYLFEKHGTGCTLMDFSKKTAITTSQKEARLLSGRGFKTIITSGMPPVARRATNLLEPALASSFFGKGMMRLVSAVEKDAKGHYDHSYA